METLTRALSRMGLSMATVNGRRSLKWKVADPTITKVITIWIRKTAGASLNGKVATPTEAVMLMMRERVLVKCVGLTAPYIEVHGIRVYSTESVSCSFLTVIEEVDSSNKMFLESI